MTKKKFNTFIVSIAVLLISSFTANANTNAYTYVVIYPS